MALCFSGVTADAVWRKAAKRLLLPDSWKQQASRCGNTRELLHVSFEVQRPRQRWVLSRVPAVSPAFAIAEVFWILAGREDAGFLNFWNPALPKYAGDGPRYYGAYGFRIRNAYGFDQLEHGYHALAANPATRQVVIQIWSPVLDFPGIGGQPRSADIPCNVCSMLKIREGALEWTQVMRSNDLMRGTPYNFIQFTTLQEIFAGWLGVEVGAYYQISDSLHVYDNDVATHAMRGKGPRVKNTDNLALPKDRFYEVLGTCLNVMERLTAGELQREEVSTLCLGADVPEGYKNLLAVAAADSARRRGWLDVSGHVMRSCTNAALRYAWRNWLEAKANGRQ